MYSNIEKGNIVKAVNPDAGGNNKRAIKHKQVIFNCFTFFLAFSYFNRII